MVAIKLVNDGQSTITVEIVVEVPPSVAWAETAAQISGCESVINYVPPSISSLSARQALQVRITHSMLTIMALMAKAILTSTSAIDAVRARNVRPARATAVLSRGPSLSLRCM